MNQARQDVRHSRAARGWIAWLWTALAAGALQSAHGSVALDQSPLTVQQSLPPNIVLMLDDSGSMAWDVMPDWGYLSSTTADALVSSAVNGVYYNPAITYQPPYAADGVTLFNNASFASAWIDGFDPSKGTVNLRSYDGSRDTSRSSRSSSDINYSATIANTTSNAYDATLSCPFGYTPVTSGSYAGKCKRNDSYFNNGTWTCPSGGSYNSSLGQCVVTTTTNTSLFTYTTKNANGSYTRYYVGPAGSCAAASLSAAVCSEAAADQQNVANWFSYYHTRILMAKSGLLNAFFNLDPTIRFGFGSINGSQAGWIDSNYLSGLRYAFSTDTQSSNYLAAVQPFGNGSSGTQKANFWRWATAEQANGGTPLRQALNAVGKYYQTAQPWRIANTDSSELACRQSYTILTSDGFWNESGVALQSNPYNDNIDGGPGSTVTTTTTSNYAATLSCPAGYTPVTTGSNAGNCKKNKRYYNLGTWICPNGGSYNSSIQKCVVMTTTTTTSPTVTNTGPNGLSYIYSAAPPYADTYADTLADVAMNYWLTDLRPSTDNEVPTSNEDPAFWQHMTTFTLGLGFTPKNISPAGTTIDRIFNWANGSAPIAGFSWPQPSADSINNIADLAHAAVNGHGGFYSATSPQDFSNALRDALKRVSERIGSGASLAANSTKLETGTVTYQAVYYTGKWKGDLKAYSVNPSTGVIATSPTWAAGAAGVLPAAASRDIRTYNPSAAAGAQWVAFSAPSTLSTAQNQHLGADLASQQAMINYLRGDPSNEQRYSGSYRNRDTALGDIVDSQPVYVGAPDANLFFGKSFSGSDSYPGFAANKLTRSPRIWVAANDGMQHSFSAENGVEAFAYLPNAVILSDVQNLGNPDYGGTALPHQYFNDGELSVADVYYSGAWHSVLVGTTGRGLAKAVYALDVTDADAPSLLWERAAGDGGANSSYIGQIIGKPVIAQTADGSWSVLVGNGYNSASGKAALLQFDIVSGSLSVHATDATSNNGLAAPAVWMADPTDGIGTTAYAGDLTGKVWSFNLSSASSTGTSLFVAKDASDNPQSITGGVLAGKDPATGNLWLYFGTGRYLTQPELGDLSVQTWYGIIVQAGSSQPAALVGNLSGGRTALRQRTILGEQAPNASTTPPALGARAISTAAEGDMSGKSGWYLDLVARSSSAKGERMVTPNQFQGSLLLGTSRVPQSSDPCNPSGSGWIMAIAPFSGAAPSSMFFDLNADSQFNSSDRISIDGVDHAAAGVGFISVPNNPIFVGNTMLVSFDNASTGSIQTAGSVGALKQLSWRELVGP